MPTVSVVIPAYNQGHYLAQAIQSVLEQSYADLEAIVVDDGSTDHTRMVVSTFQDPRLRYYYQANRGLSAARNTGIAQARGQFIAYLDADDLFLPDKLAWQVAQIEAEPQVGLVAGQAIPFDDTRQYPEKCYTSPLPADPAQLLLGNPLHVGSVLVRRAWQLQVGPFDETLRSYEDWDMWLRYALAGYGWSWVNRPVSLYRFHAAQMTGNGAQMATATFAVLDKVFQDPTLPDAWQRLRAPAYANAHLRTAAQAYLSQDFPLGKACIEKAIELEPDLMDQAGELLARRFNAWAESPKVTQRLAYLEGIYSNLPAAIQPIFQGRRRAALAHAAVQQAMECYTLGDFRATRADILKALLYDAAWLRNRGVLSMFFRSWFHTLRLGQAR